MSKEMSKKWCIKCKTELRGGTEPALLFSLGNVQLWCPNAKCPREGLLTMLFLEEQTKAPDDAKPNIDSGTTPLEESADV